MTPKVLEGIRRLQEYVFETGLARAVMSLPAPRMLSLAAPTGEAAGPVSMFSKLVIEPEIEIVTRDLFASGHYSLAVQEAYKAIDKYVGEKVGPKNVTGTQLMELAFSPSSPLLKWSNLAKQSETDEQKGYQRLFSGAMLGIRNPVTHEFNWVEDSEVALELLIFAQHLMRKAKLATLTQ